ncbi:hypothetical protein NDU88_005198 [Pleurodeles waltl]|uniref:Uncharacterized protein n=1 Tax=Pleurodeles waltl TaxID=8319 RepID=A0AAV7RK97_PLEWA|nr:hypothetical protein NDU88_005198 [Pleurodeles waltl]
MYTGVWGVEPRSLLRHWKQLLVPKQREGRRRLPRPGVRGLRRECGTKTRGSRCAFEQQAKCMSGLGLKEVLELCRNWIHKHLEIKKIKVVPAWQTTEHKKTPWMVPRATSSVTS